MYIYIYIYPKLYLKKYLEHYTFCDIHNVIVAMRTSQLCRGYYCDIISIITSALSHRHCHYICIGNCCDVILVIPWSLSSPNCHDGQLVIHCRLLARGAGLSRRRRKTSQRRRFPPSARRLKSAQIMRRRILSGIVI